MTILDKAKLALRIGSNTTIYDDEIVDLIDAARQDLILSGVLPDKANSDEDALIRRAVVVYVKANFGFDNPDADKLVESYRMLKQHLTLSSEYTLPEVMIRVIPE